MKERSWQSEKYRYGFNGKEKDGDFGDEISDFGARIYSNKIGRFFSTDPREGDYAWQSTYAYFCNSPISIIDFNGEGEDDEKPKSKGVVNVSFYSASADKKNSPDAVGVDKNGDGKDDCLVAFQDGHTNVNDPCLKKFGIRKFNEIGKILKQLKKEGYEIGNVILNAHANHITGNFFLGGKHSIPDLSKVLVGNLGTNSAIILNMCNIGAGDNPRDRWKEIQSVAVKADATIYASMSFAIGWAYMFSHSRPLSSALPINEYIRAKKIGDLGGSHWIYPNNTILYHNCYMRIGPQLSLTNNYYIVANLTIRADGSAFHDRSPFQQLQKNKALLQEAQRLGRPQTGYGFGNPQSAPNIPMRMFYDFKTNE